MKYSHQLVIGSLAVFVLTACSGSPTQRRQAKDDF
ncbi:outer membrane protein assembly factor BamC, partial [Vibrio sp. 10N.286.46.A8]